MIGFDQELREEDMCTEQGGEGITSPGRVRARRRRYTGEHMIDLTNVLILRQRHAAAALGIAQSLLSKRWKAATNGRPWPWKEVCLCRLVRYFVSLSLVCRV